MSEIFIPKWKKDQGNGSSFMRNLERHLRYEVDLEKYEAKKREIECGKENQHGAKSFNKKTFQGGLGLA